MDGFTQFTGKTVHSLFYEKNEWMFLGTQYPQPQYYMQINVESEEKQKFST